MSPGGISPTHSTIHESSQELEGVNKPGKTLNGNVDGEKGETASSSSVKVVEPVDFENNGLLWIPPGPEDVEDDIDAVLSDDGGDDATGECRHLRPSTSFGDGGSRTKEKSGEVHKKAVKNVVDGHLRVLVAQMLQVENLPVGEEDDRESWLDIITSLSWEAVTLLEPDTSKGGGMDPGGYVKIKCLACGHRSESIVKLRFLILGGALEYPNPLSSISTLSDQQEMDHLKMAVAMIDAQHPTVLLVEKSSSRSFQEYLHAKDIAVVLNLKRPLLERIACCTGGQIVPSNDNLSSRILGFCDTFRVEKFLELHGSAGQSGKKLEKTLMFFEGCPKPLGCTILLRGANGDELKKVKHVVQYGISATKELGPAALLQNLRGLFIFSLGENHLLESLQNALNREEKKGQPVIDIIEINGLRRQLIFNIYLWDKRLVYAASKDNKPFKEKLNTSAPSAEYFSEILEDAWTGKNQPTVNEDNNTAVSVGSSMANVVMKTADFQDQPEEDRRGLVDDNVEHTNPVYLPVVREFPLLGGARFFLPIGVDGTVVPVYDDEPTSVISYALASPEYHSQISGERLKDGGGSSDSKSLHATVSFTDDSPLGKVKYTVTCYCSNRFEALRRMCCPSELDFVRSFSRCKKWDKSNIFFAKSLDDRFIIKQVTKAELESFLQFAPEYFKYLTESIDTKIPTCLAKILGIYQVTSKHQNGGKDARMDVLVMENILFGRNVTRLYDLKGSSRSRYNADASGSNKVLLDQNLIEAMPTSPIFVGNKAKRFLERAVWNDTSFLASIDVMDYSLLVGVDEEKQELVVGITDFMRQYTWYKHLVMGKNFRFRKAMSEYFLMVPDEWSPQNIIPSASQSDLGEDNAVKVSSP
ncbi:hypothetical protein C5167_026572 [Papaver somniferum]|nr:hypothetical protein C5167_026572 [Papaver somniferum]